MKKAIRLFESEPDRPGFWSAGKGEFEQTWSGLEDLIKAGGGFPVEIMDQIRSDRKFANQLELLINNGGVMPSDEELRARATGIKVITQGQVLRVLTWITHRYPTYGLNVAPSRIPFSDELLRKHATTHVLLPGPPSPHSLMDMERLLPDWKEAKKGTGEGPYWIRDDWKMGVRDADFYKNEEVNSDWYLIGIVPFAETSNVDPAQMSTVIPQGETLPQACDLIYMTIMWNYVMRTILFTAKDSSDGLMIVTASKDNGGWPVGASLARLEWRGWHYITAGITCKHRGVVAVTMVEPDL